MRSAEKLLEEVTESCAVEMVFEIWRLVTESVASASSASVSYLFPLLAEFVVFLAFIRVSQDFVGFGDFLEFFLSCCFAVALHFVWVVGTGEIAEPLLYLFLRSGFIDPEDFVVIFVFDAWHG